MQAKVKDDYRWRVLNILNRTEFIKGEWRGVPAGYEDQAAADERLDTRPDELIPTADVVLAEILGDETPTADQVLEKILSGEGEDSVELTERQKARYEKLIAASKNDEAQKIIDAAKEKQAAKE